jgi:putative transposase
MIDQIKVDQGSSVRRCCRVLGFRRATYQRRKAGHRPEQADDTLAKLLRDTATQDKCRSWGFWKIFHYLRNGGKTTANHKRVYRIWRREGLHLRQPPRRKRLYRTYRDLISPDGVNEGWARDFVSDWIVGPTKKQVRIINIMDEGSRRALWTEVHRSISAKKLIEVLDEVVEYRGKPAYIRCDNGPEFIPTAYGTGPRTTALNYALSNPVSRHRTDSSNDLTKPFVRNAWTKCGSNQWTGSTKSCRLGHRSIT